MDNSEDINFEVSGTEMFEPIYQKVLKQTWQMKNVGSTAEGNVRILTEDFEIPQLKRKRRIWIYLPLNYERSQDKYPVIYMQDGQNLFDERYSYSGEWAVDKTLNELERAGHKGVIVVGIDNGQHDRLDEYSPFKNKKHKKGGDGDHYLDFIINTLKPSIDKSFRTMPDREHTAIAGSSMGGLISMYAAIKYARIFGKAMIFSPSFWFSDKIFEFVDSHKKLHSSKIYLLGGLREGAYVGKHLQMMQQILKHKGFSDKELHLVLREYGDHSEGFWKNEFGFAYRWLFDLK